MRHAIVGVGGVGGLMAAVLAKYGNEVTVVVRPGTLAKFPEEITLESKVGGPVRAKVKKTERLTEPVDVMWLSTKATQLDESLAAIANPARVGAIVPLLNGTEHIAKLRARFGQDKVVPATISVESERVAPGQIAQRSPFIRLNVAGMGRARLESTLKQLEQFGFVCHFIDDEATLLWRKLVFLAPLALSGTAANGPISDFRGDARRRQLYENCVRETAAVGRACGADVNADEVIAAFAGLAGGMKSSMQKDVEAGNPPELDAIAGPILRGAQEHGIAVPATKELVAEIESRIAATK